MFAGLKAEREVSMVKDQKPTARFHLAQVCRGSVWTVQADGVIKGSNEAGYVAISNVVPKVEDNLNVDLHHSV